MQPNGNDDLDGTLHNAVDEILASIPPAGPLARALERARQLPGKGRKRSASLMPSRMGLLFAGAAAALLLVCLLLVQHPPQPGETNEDQFAEGNRTKSDRIVLRKRAKDKDRMFAMKDVTEPTIVSPDLANGGEPNPVKEVKRQVEDANKLQESAEEARSPAPAKSPGSSCAWPNSDEPGIEFPTTGALPTLPAVPGPHPTRRSPCRSGPHRAMVPLTSWQGLVPIQ